MTKPRGRAQRWPAGRKTRRPSRAAAAQRPGSRACRPSPAPNPPAGTRRPPPLPQPRGPASPRTAAGRPIKFPPAARPGRRQPAAAVPAYLHRRLPGERRRRRAPRRTRSRPSALEATTSVNTHTHTRAHNSVLKGGPTPADLHPHTQHLGRRTAQGRSASMEPPLRICKSKSEIKPPPTSSSSSSSSLSTSSSSSLQPQQPEEQQPEQSLLPPKPDDP